MADNSILEPVKVYPELKKKLTENAEAFYEDLFKKSKVNFELNQKEIKELNHHKKHLENTKGSISRLNALRVFLIVLIIVGVICCIIGGFSIRSEEVEVYVTVLFFIGGLIAIAIGIAVLATYVRKKSAELNHIKETLESKIKKLTNLIEEQNSHLFKLFDYNMPAKIIKKTAPLIDLDEYFDMEKFTYLNQKYGFGNITDPKSSTVLDISGSIVGNPFLFVRNFNTTMGKKTYTGSITIFWTETHVDANGHRHTVTKSEVLTASVSKPYPYYGYETYLVYGNDAAPNLTFIRNPSGTKGKDEKGIAKLVSSNEKVLKKKAEKSISKGKHLTLLANTEFEALFNAPNRDNEVEFRLLFTPLAQKSFVDLIKSQEPFGDDFVFEKKKCLNYIVSQHSQHTDLYADPYQFGGFLDLKEAKRYFISYMEKYFESMYFDLAPILSIPLYQQNKPIEYIYNKKFPQNYTNYEYEVLANSLGPSNFRHPDTDTDTILKTKFERKDGDTDVISVTAYSYRGEKRTDFIPVAGRDGLIHDVPVDWVEYIPIERTSNMGVKKVEANKPQVDSLTTQIRNYFSNLSKKTNYHFERGLLAFLLDSEYTKDNDKDINNIFKSLNIEKENDDHNKEEK